MKSLSFPARVFFIIVYVLVALGIVMTYSTSAIYAQHVYQHQEYFLIRQLFYAFLGTLMMLAALSIPMEFWQRHARVMMLLSIFLLMLVYVPVIGRSGGGAQRWLHLGPLNFQPAEFAKVAVCIYLADYLTRKIRIVKTGNSLIFLPPLILIGMICLLTLLQPDLGSTGFILLLVFAMFFLTGLNMRYVVAVLAVIAPAFYFLVLKVPYRAARVTAYLNPWDDPQGSGFQIIQSFLSFATGGVQGVGLGQGIQKLFYLPSSHNDFIFSVIGEELGLVGLVVVLLLYGALFVCGIMMAERARRDYDRLLILAFTLMIVLQAIVHMLVTTGLIPTKGLPLPFVSYGGTSILFNLMAVGLLLAADSRTRGR